MKVRVLLLVSIALLIFFVSLFLGPVPINPFSLSGTEREIVLFIRLPRVIVAALMGTALGAAGAVLQGMLRNPLADPYILGLSSGATLTASAGIISGMTFMGAFTIPVLAFAGAMATGALVGLMGWRRGGLLPERLLLAGIGLGFLFSAVVMLLMSVSTNEGLRRAVMWMFGDLGMADWGLIPSGAVFIALGLVIAMLRAKALNSLILGDDLSHSLGFSPRKETVLLFTATGLLTASSVSLGGMVGFVGLIMPHIMRFFVGPDSRVLIPASAIGGGMLLVVADLIGRTVFQPTELPSGIITALLGAPYFLYLLRRRDVLGI
ncbi:MAG: iron ABC transporter permease [Thermodesulfovibrionales bacterium]|nr:iron ABC transporter permease [Thermodesulfovibrionales bacterium]